MHKTWIAAGCSCALLACAPTIANLNVTSVDGSQPLRTGMGLKVSADINPNRSNMNNPKLRLTRTQPPGAMLERELPGPQPSGSHGYALSFEPNDPALVLEQGSQWDAVVIAPYIYGWSPDQVTSTAHFEVREPARCFGFLTSSQASGWTLHGYYQNDSSNVLAPAHLQWFDDNWPETRAGDGAIGLQLHAPDQSSSSDLWRVEFVSPALYGQNRFEPWAGIRAWDVQVRTDAQDLQAQALVTAMDNGGNVHVYRMTDASGNPIFFHLIGDDAWHTVHADFRGYSLAPRILSVSLAVFGSRADTGRRLLIDQPCRTD